MLFLLLSHLNNFRAPVADKVVAMLFSNVLARALVPEHLLELLVGERIHGKEGVQFVF